MKSFRYLRDPLFLFCVVIYFLNRLILKPYLPNAFSQFYLNDLICIPVWLPIMLFAMRKTGLRQDDRPPTWYEVSIPLLVWSFAFELIAPYTQTFRGIAFGDHIDILCYACGGLVGAIFWSLRWRDAST
jgi:hypothetical protein